MNISFIPPAMGKIVVQTGLSSLVWATRMLFGESLAH